MIGRITSSAVIAESITSNDSRFIPCCASHHWPTGSTTAWGIVSRAAARTRSTNGSERAVPMSATRTMTAARSPSGDETRRESAATRRPGDALRAPPPPVPSSPPLRRQALPRCPAEQRLRKEIERRGDVADLRHVAQAIDERDQLAVDVAQVVRLRRRIDSSGPRKPAISCS